MGLAPIAVEEVFHIITSLKSRDATMLLAEQFAATAPQVLAAYLGGAH